MAQRIHQGDGFGHSLTDLMTSIAVIFILLFLLFLQNEREEIASRKRRTETNLEKIFAQLDGELSADVDIQKDPDDPLTLLIVLRDNPEILSFAYNRAEIREKGTLFLQDFIPKLSEIVCGPESEGIVDSLIIEGHTDSKGSHDTNTVLSALRATAVLIESHRILSARQQDQSLPESRIEECFLHFSQATGRGEQELIFDDLVENKAASRRVVIKIRVKSMEQRESLARLPEASLGS
jgi:outer membrane protein OmpA-like peptidoglycan-associated protein